jgi:hypothetical protein
MSQLLTLYTTPVVYLYLDRFRIRCGNLRRRITGRTGRGSLRRLGGLRRSGYS